MAAAVAAEAGGQPTSKPDVLTSELSSKDAAALRRASRLAGAACKHEQSGIKLAQTQSRMREF